MLLSRYVWAWIKHTGINSNLFLNKHFFNKNKNYGNVFEKRKWRILAQSRSCNWQQLVQHINESRKPRLDMMYIGLIVALGLAC